ncbi:MAG TPA: ABC transporter substrate-binding protein [Rhizobiales bacterium]|nr:ABC transporter substrate-binding protein [Hyphomicrobiales bacterium]
MAFSVRACAAFAAAFFALADGSAASETVGTLPDSSRLVAIGGSITEIVYALGEEKRLIARDTTSVYPPAALTLPDIGYMRQLSPEGVLSVGPSAVIALEGSGPREAIDVLRKASVPFLEVPERFDGDGILVKIRTVGAALGVTEKAEALAKTVAADLDAAGKATASIGARKRVMFLLGAQGGKLLASGSGTAADGVIRLAGAVNAVEGYEGYKPITDEAVIAAAPDVILIMDRGGGEPDPSAGILANPAIASTPAGRAKRLVRMDAAYLLGFGPRTAAAVRDLAAQLYGDQVLR